MSSAQSANYWQVETIKAIRNMFDDQVDEEVVTALFQENESDIERTVDAVLQHIRDAEAKQKELEHSKQVSELEEEFEEIEEEIEVSQSQVSESQASISVEESNYSDSIASSTSSNNSVLIYEEKPDFTISEMETQTEYTPEEKLVQTEVEELFSPDLRRFQERIEELALSLSEAKFAKVRVEEEKKNAMKWCVAEMESLRTTVAEKDIIILKQQEEIEMLKKMAQQPKAPVQDDNKLDKFIVESKQMIVEGVQNLSQQLSENIGKIQKEFKKVDEKDWVVVEKLKEFAADFRREIAELFKEPSNAFRKSPKKIVSSPVVPRQEVNTIQAKYEEEKQVWQLEKASLESYIKELERQIKGYKEAAARNIFVSERDIELVACQANVDNNAAREALITEKGDVVNAIISLTL